MFFQVFKRKQGNPFLIKIPSVSTEQDDFDIAMANPAGPPGFSFRHTFAFPHMHDTLNYQNSVGGRVVRWCWVNFLCPGSLLI